MPKTRPETTRDEGDKGCHNFTSSVEFSHMEYDHDLKTYCYQNETKESYHNIGFFFYRNFLNENKWKKHQEKL